MYAICSLEAIISKHKNLSDILTGKSLFLPEIDSNYL